MGQLLIGHEGEAAFPDVAEKVANPVVNR